MSSPTRPTQLNQILLQRRQPGQHLTPGDNAIGLDPDGYSEAVFDGRYVYFVPYHNGTSFHGEVMRYDTHLATDDGAAWSTFDPGFPKSDGFSGGTFDGRYVYFSPNDNDEVLRFDTQGSFTDIAAWDTFDPGTGGGYEGVTFDGTYLYFAPWSGGSSSEVLRYDTTADFNTAGSWDTFDLDSGVTTADGFDGIEFDGRYVYLVPLRDGGNEHGVMVRYDTLGTFNNSSSWEVYDVESQFGSSVVGFSGAIFDGQYMYYTPLYNDSGVHGTVLRYDTSRGFTDSAAWESYNVEAQFGNDGRGFLDQTFDGRYLYLTPYDDGSQFSGNVVRYDTQGSFNDSNSWSEFNPGANGVGDDPRGYWGAIYDGRNVHFVPIRTSWGGNEHGEVLILDTHYSMTGQGSLRQFIHNSNALVGVQSSLFAIPTSDSGYNLSGNGEFTIVVAADGLPYLLDQTILDATTQSGYSGDPIIELDGSLTPASSGINGISLRTSNSVVRGFIVHSFADEGIEIDGSTGFGDNNVIQNNWVGINASGNIAANAEHNVMISVDATGNLIGGANANDGNVIGGSNSGFSGVVIRHNSDNNRVQGNWIGVRQDGTLIGNGDHGVLITTSSDNNQIGGALVEERNIIAGNSVHGVYVDGTTDATYTTIVTGTLIQGNWIGTVGTGSVGVGNGNTGIYIRSARNTNIGGTGTNEGNVITNNANEGITITGTNATGSIIQGNIIGLDPDGSTGGGNADVGIALLSGADNTTIGGTAPGARNVISNNFEGIEINSNNNVVQGNYIGTDISGTLDRGNRSDDGVEIQNSSNGNLIGGTESGAGNLIAFNALDGVRIASGTGNSVLGNVIHSNGTLGIDIATNGATANDSNDGDSGANNVQNFPLITSAVVSGTDLTLSGSLDTDGASTQYRLEFFGIPSGSEDATGFGQGNVYLGFTNVTTDGSGDVTFSNVVLSGVTLVSGDSVTATATRITDAGQIGIDDAAAFSDTSEFAANVTVTPPAISVPVAQATNEDTNLIFSTGNGNPVSITDIDASGADMEVTVAVTNGMLSLAQTTGLTFTTGDGTADATMTFTGSETDINAALDGLVYAPTDDYHGADTLSITAERGGVVGHYTFDASDAADSSPGTAQHGTFQGDATTVTDGTRGEVLSLDGTRDYVEISGTFGDPSNVTLAAWVNLDSGAGPAEVISLGDSVTLRLNNNGTHLFSSFYNGSGWQWVQYAVDLAGAGWTHVAYSFDDTNNSQKLYLDGVEVASGSYTGSIDYSLGINTTIGAHGDGATSWDFDGMIDDARIYTRALSADEIANLANDETFVDTKTVAITVNPVNDEPVNTLTPTFTANTLPGTVTGPGAVGAGDFDGDGDIDIVAATLGDTSDSSLYWYQNDGAENFTQYTITTAGMTASVVRDLDVADVDGDGDLDIVTVSQNDDRIAWWSNDGSGNFTQNIESSALDRLRSVEVVDFDGDGDVDIIAGGDGTGDTIHYLENDGAENFTVWTVETAATAGLVSSLEAGDMDGDGDLDIVAAALTSDAYLWFEHQGGGTFVTHTIDTAVDGAAYVSLADIDGDGDLDVATAGDLRQCTRVLPE